MTRSGSSTCPRCLRVTCPRSLTQWFGTWWEYRICRCGAGKFLWLCVFSLSLFCSFGVVAPFSGVRRSRLVCSATLQGSPSCCRGKFPRSPRVLTIVESRCKAPRELQRQVSSFVSEGSISRGQHGPRSRRVLTRSRVPVCSYSGRGPIFGCDVPCKRFIFEPAGRSRFKSAFGDGEPLPPSSLHGALLHIPARDVSQSSLPTGWSDISFLPGGLRSQAHFLACRRMEDRVSPALWASALTCQAFLGSFNFEK